MPDTEAKTYLATIAKIESTFLGWEDHGIFTFNLELAYNESSRQGFGNYAITNDHGVAILQAVLRAAAVDSWERLEGRTVYALAEHYGDLVRGLAPLPTERGKGFVVTEDGIEPYTVPL